MTSSEALKTLSEPVRTRLRSTQILTSVPQVVSELVQNALDASASHVDIGVDCQEWECWVKDDGRGIPRSSLDVLSKSYEAGRYSRSLIYQLLAQSRPAFASDTSKAYSLGSLGEVCTFGFRGEGMPRVLCSQSCLVRIAQR
jgi:DNA mismatch repair protein MLH3